MPMPPRFSSRRMRYFGWRASSGGTSGQGTLGIAGRLALLAALPGRAKLGGNEEPAGPAARTFSRKESAFTPETTLRQAGHDSRWAAMAAAACWGNLPSPKAASSCGVGWITASVMANFLSVWASDLRPVLLASWVVTSHGSRSAQPGQTFQKNSSAVEKPLGARASRPHFLGKSAGETPALRCESPGFPRSNAVDKPLGHLVKYGRGARLPGRAAERPPNLYTLALFS